MIIYEYLWKSVVSLMFVLCRYFFVLLLTPASAIGKGDEIQYVRDTSLRLNFNFPIWWDLTDYLNPAKALYFGHFIIIPFITFISANTRFDFTIRLSGISQSKALWFSLTLCHVAAVAVMLTFFISLIEVKNWIFWVLVFEIVKPQQ